MFSTNVRNFFMFIQLLSFKNNTLNDPEKAFSKAVAENGPVSVAVDASGFHQDRGGIYYDKNC